MIKRMEKEFTYGKMGPGMMATLKMTTGMDKGK